MRINKIHIISASVLLTAFFTSCNTPMERRGYSNIPQNYPASWESGKRGGGI